MKWISVKEKLPKTGERVIATDGEYVGEFYRNINGKWKRILEYDEWMGIPTEIIYWMPMPEPPEEDN